MLKTLYQKDTGEIDYAFTLIGENKLEYLNKILPWFEIIGHKNLNEYPVPVDPLKSYKDLFFKQPELLGISPIKSEGVFKWYPYSDIIKEIFCDRSINLFLQNSLVVDEGNWKKYFYKKLLISISIAKGDISGSIVHSEFEDINNLSYRIFYIKNQMTEYDWKEIFKVKSPQLNYLCPDYSEFIYHVESTFGFINFEINPLTGSISKYLPKTDRYDLADMEYIIKFIGSKGTEETKLRKVCETLSNPTKNITIEDLFWLPWKIREPIERLGIDRIKALGYSFYYIRQDLLYLDLEFLLKERIQGILKIGKAYPRKYIKSLIKDLLIELKFPRSLPASTIKKFFEIKEVLMSGERGKRVHGYKILKKL